MKVRRNWFLYLTYALYLAAALLSLIFGMGRFEEYGKDPYLLQIIMILGFFAGFIVINLILYLISRPALLRLFAHLKKYRVWTEGVLVLALLSGGMLLRIYFIRHYPVDMESDYKFYYDIAVMVRNGTLTEQANNEFISLFPNTYGYAYLLSAVMRIFGTGKEVCLYLNAAFSVITSLFCYGIGRRLSGSAAGLSALAITCFWPSQIIYSNFNGSEASFTFLLYGAALLAVILTGLKENTRLNSFTVIFLHVACGALIELASAIRPMGLILLIAFVICLLSIHKKLQYKNINELPLKTIFLSKGIVRALVVVFGYLICAQLVTASMERAIQREIPSNGAMGYSLMVGTNIQSDGVYSDEVTKFLYDQYEATGSAKAANDACMDQAVEQIRSDPKGIAELMAKKFFMNWSNDEYSAVSNSMTMINQGILTPERDELFSSLLPDICNVYYLFVVFLSAIGILLLVRRDNPASLFALLFVGTIALFLLVEFQNRYHYYILQSFAILAASGIGFLFEEYRKRSLAAIEKRKKQETQLAGGLVLTAGAQLADDLAAAARAQYTDESAVAAEEEPGEESRSEYGTPASGNSQGGHQKPDEDHLHSIDVLKAIEDGHIIITATKAYAEEAAAAQAGPKEGSYGVDSSEYMKHGRSG